MKKNRLALYFVALILLFVISSVYSGYRNELTRADVTKKIIFLAGQRTKGDTLIRIETADALEDFDKISNVASFDLTMEAGYLSEYFGNFQRARRYYELASKNSNGHIEKITSIRALGNLENRNLSFQDWKYMQQLKKTELERVAMLPKIDLINYSAFSYDTWAQREKYQNIMPQAAESAEQAAYFYELKEKLYPGSKFVEEFNARYRDAKIGERPNIR